MEQLPTYIFLSIMDFLASRSAFVFFSFAVLLRRQSEGVPILTRIAQFFILIISFGFLPC